MTARAKLVAEIARLQDKLARMDAGSLHPLPSKKERRKAKQKKNKDKKTENVERQQSAGFMRKARKLWQPSLCTMPYQEYLQTDYWMTIRKLVYAVRGRKCQRCNARDCELHVHHTSYAYRGKEHLGLKTLQVLCAAHHREAHGIKDPNTDTKL
jgi:hypothetical protein